MNAIERKKSYPVTVLYIPDQFYIPTIVAYALCLGSEVISMQALLASEVISMLTSCLVPPMERLNSENKRRMCVLKLCIIKLFTTI